MNELARSATGRRHVLDGTFTVLFLLLAVVQGYVVLLITAPHPPAAVTMVVPPSTNHAPRENHASALATVMARPLHEATIMVTAGAAPESPAPAFATIPNSPAPPRPTPQAITPPPSAPIAPAIRGEWPAKVTGRVLGPDTTGMANVSVVAGGTERRTDAEGGFTLDHVPADTAVIVKMPGYEKVTLLPGPNQNLEVMLKPHAVKAAYLTYYGVSDRGIRTRVLDLIARTELNAVVIDIKGDRGWIPYRTEVEAALAAGAQGPVIMKDFAGLIADLKARGVYTIARIVTFKDNILANHRPDLAITDTRTGKPWIDNEKLAWVDPFREEVWAYNIAIAKEAASKGFDEIQFDYVRFPTDGRLSAARYSRPNNKETRLPTIAGFLGRARRELGPLGVFVAADVFGYTAFNENDTDIGQRIEELAPNLDYICPMVYPSGYHVGIPGFRNPVLNPYEVVNQSVKLIRKRSAGLTVQVRPWLQDFKDYAFDKRIFGVAEIRAQIRGADEGGGVGWMLWNPRNDYTGAALRPKGPMASR